MWMLTWMWILIVTRMLMFISMLMLPIPCVVNCDQEALCSGFLLRFDVDVHGATKVDINGNVDADGDVVFYHGCVS